MLLLNKPSIWQDFPLKFLPYIYVCHQHYRCIFFGILLKLWSCKINWFWHISDLSYFVIFNLHMSAIFLKINKTIHPNSFTIFIITWLNFENIISLLLCICQSCNIKICLCPVCRHFHLSLFPVLFNILTKIPSFKCMIHVLLWQPCTCYTQIPCQSTNLFMIV